MLRNFSAQNYLNSLIKVSHEKIMERKLLKFSFHFSYLLLKQKIYEHDLERKF